MAEGRLPAVWTTLGCKEAAPHGPAPRHAVCDAGRVVEAAARQVLPDLWLAHREAVCIALLAVGRPLVAVPRTVGRGEVGGKGLVVCHATCTHGDEFSGVSV